MIKNLKITIAFILGSIIVSILFSIIGTTNFFNQRPGTILGSILGPSLILFLLPLIITYGIKLFKRDLIGDKFLKGYSILWVILCLMILRGSYLTKQKEIVSVKQTENVFKDLKVPIYAEKIINEINKSCPRMIDKNTQIDNVVALPDNIIMYNYSFVNYKKEDIDVEGLKNAATSIYINRTKTEPEMEIFKEHDTTLKWNYKDKDGIYLFTVTITPELYR